MTRDLDEYVLFLFGFMRPYKGEQALLFIKKDQWTPPKKKTLDMSGQSVPIVNTL